MLTVTSFDSLPITPLQWRKILEKASGGAEPAGAHLFLRDARRALNEGHTRRSVLDSATAAEVGLTRLRDNALANAAPKLAEYTRDHAQQIMRLVRFLDSVGKKLPGRIQQDIAEPRNRAIHEGEQPDREAAATALAKAEEIVDLAFPWKKLL
jgi:HEPN domain-containing protein